jgi:hypothetical protein
VFCQLRADEGLVSEHQEMQQRISAYIDQKAEVE